MTPHPVREQTADVAGARRGGLSGVVVLGMGRSGTSAVTRMFERSGYYVGADADLMPADESNPTGYFEHWGVHSANELVLARIDGSWLHVPEMEADAQDPGCVEPLREALADLLTAAGEAPLAVKDPRIGMLLSLWLPLMEGLLHPVLVVRDPLEIAISLERRDRTPVPVGLAMWEVHMSRVLAGLAGRRATVVPYQQVLDVPDLAGRLVDEASVLLSPELRASLDPAGAASALEAEHHRNVRDETAEIGWLTPRQRGLWRLLAALAPGTTLLRPPDWAIAPDREALRITAHESARYRDQVNAARRSEQLARSLATSTEQLIERDATIAGMDAQLTQLSERHAAASRRAAALEAQLERAEQARRSAELKLAAAEHWLGEFQRSASWRATRPLRTLKRLLRRAAR